MNKTDDQVWPTTEFNSINELMNKFEELEKKKDWVFRGQANLYPELNPSIDRKKWREIKQRAKKLEIERQSIEQMRIWNCAPEDNERRVLHKGITHDDVSYATCYLETLMLLQHYGVPTRLLDWSFSPYVAGYFSVVRYFDCDNDDHDKSDGEIWAFDSKKFQDRCAQHWVDFPEIKLWYDWPEPKVDFFEHILRTAFAETDPGDWIMPGYYYDYFPRYSAQKGLFTIIGDFGIDHASKISKRLGDTTLYHHFIIGSKFKKELREILKKKGYSRGTMYPDSAGAAGTVNQTLNESFLTVSA
jgi:hypothetical protein